MTYGHGASLAHRQEQRARALDDGFVEYSETLRDPEWADNPSVREVAAYWVDKQLADLGLTPCGESTCDITVEGDRYRLVCRRAVRAG